VLAYRSLHTLGPADVMKDHYPAWPNSRQPGKDVRSASIIAVVAVYKEEIEIAGKTKARGGRFLPQRDDATFVLLRVLKEL